MIFSFTLSYTEFLEIDAPLRSLGVVGRCKLTAGVDSSLKATGFKPLPLNTISTFS